MGGPVRAGKWLLEPLKVAFEANMLNIFKGKVKILTSELPQNDVAILGASALVYER